jgi:hypothetical protein
MPDHHAGASGIDANVIGIFAQIDPSDRRIVIPAKQADRSVARVRDVHNIRCRQIGDALRFSQTAKGAHDVMAGKIDNANAVILQICDE